MSDIAALISAKPAAPPPIGDDDKLVGIQNICRWHGVVSRTIDRWIRNPAVAFPEPDRVVNNRRYWKVGTVRRWDQARQAKAA